MSRSSQPGLQSAPPGAAWPAPSVAREPLAKPAGSAAHRLMQKSGAKLATGSRSSSRSGSLGQSSNLGAAEDAVLSDATNLLLSQARTNLHEPNLDKVQPSS